MAICVDMANCEFTKATSAPENAFTPNLARLPPQPRLLMTDIIAAQVILVWLLYVGRISIVLGFFFLQNSS
jgi:hypothetical protein